MPLLDFSLIFVFILIVSFDLSEDQKYILFLIKFIQLTLVYNIT